MGITASNYTQNSYIYVETPSISINLNTVTEEELNNIVSNFGTQSNNYVNTFVNAFNNREYVMDRLEKDMCIEVGLSSVDKISNQYTANIKADNYFTQVNGNNKLFNDASTINTIYNNLISLKNNLFNDENQSNVSYGGEGWSTDKTLPPVVYDTQAISITNSALGIEGQGNVIFIKDVANSIENNRTFTAYKINSEYNSSDENSEQYIAEYTISYNNNEDILRWQIKTVGENSEVLKTTSTIDNNIEWSGPVVIVSEINENINQPDSNIVIRSNTPVSNKKTIVAKSIVVKQQNISNGTIVYQADDNVNISNLTTNGNLDKEVSNAQININNEGNVQITNSNINQTGYNAIEIGLQKTVKTVLIDNVVFNSELTNNAISIFDTEDNATITISNCTFRKCSNPLRISNKQGNKVTINFVNCNFIQWGSGECAGCVLCQDYTSADASEAQQNNLFEESKVSINFTNCYHNGQKIAFTNKEDVCGTKDNNQLVYVYVNKEGGFIDFNDGSRYPALTAK